MQKMIGGGDPFYLKFWVKVTALDRNRRFSFSSPVAPQPYRLIGKRVVDFLVMLIELFSLGVTAEALRAIVGSKSAISFQRGLVDPKF